MIVKLDKNAVMEKMEELCTAFLKQEAYKELREMVDQFASDEKAVEQYERFMEKQHSLQQKEHQGLELEQAEIDDYNQEERAIYENSVIRKFIFAQREFTNLHQSISQYFAKSIELDRLPEPGDFEKGACGCGGSCGSGH